MTEYGRSRKKNTERKAGRTALSLAAVFLLCVLIFCMLLELSPSIKEKTVSFAERAGIERIFLRKEPETEPVPEETVPETPFEPENPEEDVPAGSQAITVAVATEPETEPETESAPPKYTESEDTKLLQKESGEPVELLFAGDILFDPRYSIMASMLSRSGNTPEIETAFSAETLSLMRKADIFVVNNEFPYSSRGTPLPEKQFTFRADPAYAPLLTDMGADLVALANNHMYDHGKTALLDTLDTLSSLGIPYAGAGRNLEEASAPFYFTNGDIRIGFICATQIERMGNPDTKGATETEPGVFRCMNSSLLCEKIREMEETCDFTVAYLHWGTESTEKVDDWQRNLAAEVSEAGADLIIGDHPHVLQGIDTAGGVPVIYSLGNYLFNSNAQDTCLFRAVLDPASAEILSLEFIPCRQEGCRTKVLTGEEKERVIGYMRTQSGVTIDDEGTVTY